MGQRVLSMGGAWGLTRMVRKGLEDSAWPSPSDDLLFHLLTELLESEDEVRCIRWLPVLETEQGSPVMTPPERGAQCLCLLQTWGNHPLPQSLSWKRRWLVAALV